MTLLTQHPNAVAFQLGLYGQFSSMHTSKFPVRKICLHDGSSSFTFRVLFVENTMRMDCIWSSSKIF